MRSVGAPAESSRAISGDAAMATIVTGTRIFNETPSKPLANRFADRRRRRRPSASRTSARAPRRARPRRAARTARSRPSWSPGTCCRGRSCRATPRSPARANPNARGSVVAIRPCPARLADRAPGHYPRPLTPRCWADWRPPSGMRDRRPPPSSPVARDPVPRVRLSAITAVTWPCTSSTVVERRHLLGERGVAPHRARPARPGPAPVPRNLIVVRLGDTTGAAAATSACTRVRRASLPSRTWLSVPSPRAPASRFRRKGARSRLVVAAR